VAVQVAAAQDTVEHPELAQLGKDLPAAAEEHMVVAQEVVLGQWVPTEQVPMAVLVA
jgi:hypothetical protein